MNRIFGAAWCGPCQQLKTQLKNAGFEDGVDFRFVDVDQNADEAQEAGVRSVPLLVTEAGDRVLGVPNIMAKFRDRSGN